MCQFTAPRVINWTSKIFAKLDLDSLNASEEEWKLVRAFAQINLSLLIAYFCSMVSEIGDIILELGDCQGWALSATLPLMCSRNPKLSFVSILLTQFVIPIHLHIQCWDLKLESRVEILWMMYIHCCVINIILNSNFQTLLFLFMYSNSLE